MPPTLAESAREAYMSGWALSGAPLTGQAHTGCEAAASLACEQRHDPAVLETTLKLGHLTGVWATVYDRRHALLAKHTKRVMAAWNDLVRDLDPRELARQFRSAAYLTGPSESISPQKKFWRDTGVSLALAWLRQILHADGWAALVSALEDAISDGMAEGEADALAVAASRRGKTGFRIAKAFSVARGREQDVSRHAEAAAASMIAAVAGAAGRRLSALAGDDGDEDGMADGARDVISGPAVPTVAGRTDGILWGALGTGAMALFANAGVQLVNWGDVADERECQTCRSNADNSPYTYGNVPPFPAHDRCRCDLSPADPVPWSFLADFLGA
jgi:hypothetical protein